MVGIIEQPYLDIEPLIHAQMTFMAERLHLERIQATTSRLQLMLVYLYLNRESFVNVRHFLIPPSWWVKMELNEPQWSSNQDAIRRMEITWFMYEFEAFTLRCFRELLNTNKEWTVWQAPCLTIHSQRWVEDLESVYFGLPDDCMVNYLRDAAETLMFYITLERNVVVQHNVTDPYALTGNLWKLYDWYSQRISWLGCVWRLRPEDRSFKKDYLRAWRDLRKIFPKVKDRGLGSAEWVLPTADGISISYYKVPAPECSSEALRYLPRAQRMVHNIQNQPDKAKVVYGYLAGDQTYLDQAVEPRQASL